MINFLIWNIRGILKADASNRLKGLIRSRKLGLFVVLEPMVDRRNIGKILRRFIGFSFYGNISNKIWIFWRPEFKIQIIYDEEQFIHVALSDVNIKVQATFIYACCSQKKRKELWNSMELMSKNMPDPWMVGGDLNMIANTDEKKGGRRPDINKVLKFAEYIEKTELFDIGFSGPKYTWKRGRLLERLDRCLFNNLWFQHFNHTKVQHLAFLASDHRPLQISFSITTAVKSSCFRFINAWTIHPDYIVAVRENWSCNGVEQPGVRLWKLHKNLATTLRIWNRNVFGNIQDNIKETEKKLIESEEIYELSNLEEDKLNRDSLQEKLQALIDREESFWMQKAACNNFLLGDRNTKYFQALVKKKRETKCITKIKDENLGWIKEDREIASSCIKHFQKLFTGRKEKMNLCNTKNYFMEDRKETLNMVLDNKPEHTEILKAIRNMGNNKVAGPDGFSVEFYLQSWEIIGEDVYKAIENFFETGFLHRYFKSSSIILIPKSNECSNWDSFRPIWLSPVFGKIISKIVALRLQKLLPKIISLNQSAFIEGRNIMDNILLTQEMAEEIDKKGRGGNVIIKLDIRKAFDTVEWDFILYILRCKGFQESFIGIIHNILSNNYCKMIINGEAHGFFGTERGVRQGDPLSPSLFILAMDYLSKLIDDKMTKNKNCTYHCRGTNLVTHLVFADDLIIFCNGSKKSIQIVLEVLEEFMTISGMQLNVSKCSFTTGKQVSKQQIEWIKKKTGFTWTNLPMKYLGINIYKGRNKSELYGELISNLKSKIYNWENSLLSIGGRATIIRSILNSIPLYTLQACQPPKKIIREIESILTRFFWSHKARSIHWASWKNLCKPRDMGGMAFSDLNVIVESNIMNAWFRFRKQQSLWSKYMYRKYCNGTHPICVQPRNSDSRFWRKMLNIRDKAEQLIFWDVGAGDLDFWNDHWLEGGTIAEKINLDRGAKFNKIKDFRQNNDWIFPPEIQNQQVLKKKLQEFQFADKGEDRLLLKLNNGRSMQKTLHYEKWQNLNKQKWGKKIWDAMFKPSMAIFNWKIMHDFLPTDDILKMKGIRTVSICHLCRKEEESMDHIFSSCEFTKQAWKKFDWEQHMGRRPLLPWADFLEEIQENGNKLWKQQFVFFWFIWLARNSAKHDGETPKSAMVAGRSHAYGCKFQQYKNRGVLNKIQQQCNLKLIYWIKPSRKSIKINIDGCFEPNRGKAGVGGIFRNYKGKCTMLFALPVVAISSLQAEYMALWWAIQIIEKDTSTTFWIETDSMQLVNNLTNQNVNELHWSILPTHRRIVEKLRKLKWSCSHILREGNSVADHLAKTAMVSELGFVSKKPDEVTERLIKSDNLDLPYIRNRL